MTPVFVIGYPGGLGGANTECWHTLRLWRRFGLEVTLIPTWTADAVWRDRTDRLGCRTVTASPETLGAVPGLKGAVAVSFCNTHFLRHAGRFHDLGCRIVWVNCMTWLFPDERRHYRRHGPLDRYVFQSDYQEAELLPQLARFGVAPEQCRRIRGAFCWDEFPFAPRPHEAATPLVIGRLSRAAADKYAADTWSTYARIAEPIRARLMGWNRAVEKKLGPPPPWAECLAECAEPPLDFLRTLHAMIPVNGGAGENWPRCGLEAMAAGVPIVAENRWGWREMIRHGQTGYLADSPEEMARYANRLAVDESHRLEIARRARKAIEEELANPEEIWSKWKGLFESLRD
jgi:hypothetical protein